MNKTRTGRTFLQGKRDNCIIQFVIDHNNVSGDKDLKNFEYVCNHPSIEGYEVLEAFDENKYPIQVLKPSELRDGTVLLAKGKGKSFSDTYRVIVPTLYHNKDTIIYLKVKKHTNEKGTK